MRRIGAYRMGLEHEHQCGECFKVFKCDCDEQNEHLSCRWCAELFGPEELAEMSEQGRELVRQALDEAAEG